MAGKSLMPVFSVILLALFAGVVSNRAEAQQTPRYPVSFRIFSPQLFNPATVGSKDNSEVFFMAGRYGETSSQLLGLNSRLMKRGASYISSPGYPEFRNAGLGGFIFNDVSEHSRNTGLGGSFSYHLPLGDDELSFLSFGLTAKAVFNRYSGDPDLGETAKTSFFPDFDAGIYFYGPNLFAGISAVNLMGKPDDPDTTDSYVIQASREYYFQIGYKALLIESWGFVIEPSLIVNTGDTLSGKFSDMLKPALKIYAGNFCAGTFINDFHKTSIFFQFKYPSFYIGTYFEMHNNSPFFRMPLRAEIVLGLNLSSVKSGFSRKNHW
jgi:type IX secretion system PorP/SprF family membrane protein